MGNFQAALCKQEFLKVSLCLLVPSIKWMKWTFSLGLAWLWHCCNYSWGNSLNGFQLKLYKAGDNETSISSEAKGLVFIIPAGTWSSLLKLRVGDGLKKFLMNLKMFPRSVENSLCPSLEHPKQSSFGSKKDFSLRVLGSERNLSSTDGLIRISMNSWLHEVLPCAQLRNSSRALQHCPSQLQGRDVSEHH